MSARGAHPTLRLDHFMRATDPVHRMAEAPSDGHRFIRKMATYGHGRPQPAFTGGSRAARIFKGGDGGAMDMSHLPPEHMESHGDPRELTLSYPEPPTEVTTDFVKGYENHGLMLPSERFKEHLAMKDGERTWREERAKVFEHNRRTKLISSAHMSGVCGIDSPLMPGTQLYKKQRETIEEYEKVTSKHAAGRFDVLEGKMAACDTVTFKNYATPMEPYVRSADIPLQRRRVDPDGHRFRFLNTHERLFPVDVPLWDPDRARVLRGHETRGRDYNPINGGDTSISFVVRPPPEDDGPLTARRQMSRTVPASGPGGGAPWGTSADS